MLVKRTSNLPEIHPLMDVLADEIHSRSFPHIQNSVTLSQVTLLHEENDKASQVEHLRILAKHYQANIPDENASYYYEDLGEVDIRWEYHTEFSTYTFIRHNADETAFDCTGWSVLPEEWRSSLPGKLIAATHVDIQPSLPDSTVLKQIFQGFPLTASDVADNNAQLWTTFKNGDDGFDKLLIIDRGLKKYQTGRLLRCLLEISSYRIMTLMSLPVSKVLLPVISEMENKLAQITLKVSDIDHGKSTDKKLLSQLSLLSAQLESLFADHQYRFDASNAYMELLIERLDELSEKEVSGKATISDYLIRRIAPAVRTGTSVKQRMLNVSNRIEKASDLLRTSINLALEEQNQALLKAINRRSHIQLRLTQLVESVSMIAISFYVIQLVRYMLVLPQSWLDVITKEQLVALSVPFVVMTVWWVLRKIKKRWRKESS